MFTCVCSLVTPRLVRRIAKNRWEQDLVPLLRRYHEDRAATYALQQKVVAWWIKWKYSFRAQLAKDIEGLF